MENKRLKRYIISLAEKKLNRCGVFVRAYGKDFVRQRLNVNLEKIYTNVYSNIISAEFYDKCITIFSTKKNAMPLTVDEIKSNLELQQVILHEIIHAIFNRTPEECKKYGIESGTGILEIYSDGSELGRGLNEGLTEWISEKAGYRLDGDHKTETNIVKMLELAIGEDAVIQLAKGNIKENVVQVLKMPKEQCVQMLASVDNIYIEENEIKKIEAIIKVLAKRKNKILTPKKQKKLEKKLGEYYDKYLEIMKELDGSLAVGENINDVNIQLDYFRVKIENAKRSLDMNIIRSEQIIFENYFRTEIEDAQRAETITRKNMKRLNKLYSSIQGGENVELKCREEYFQLQFKDCIYEALVAKYRPTIFDRLTMDRQFWRKRSKLPVVKKEGWFNRINRLIKRKFAEESEYKGTNTTVNEIEHVQGENFKEDIRNFSNYSEMPGNQPTFQKGERSGKTNIPEL